MPQSGLSNARHMTPTTMGVSSIGRMSAPRTNHEPRSFWLKNSANAVPRTTWRTTAAPTMMVVLPAAFQKNGSLKIAT